MKKIFTLFSCLIFLACGSTNETTSAQIKTLEPGDIAPAFNLKNIDGKMISPETYPDAKGFIMVFTSNTCPISKAYEDRLIALGNKYNSRSYQVIAVNANRPGFFSGDSYENMQKRAKTKEYSFPYVFDEGQIVTDQYGARVTPHVFILKREESGLKVVYTGAIDNDTQDENPNKILYVEDAVSALEAGEKIKVASTKAIGCTVKRS